MKLLGDTLINLDGLGLLAEIHEELCDLVGVHARGWDLDGSGPVEVVVAQVIGQPLDDCLLKGRVIVGNIEVSGKDTTLSCCLGDKVEIVLRLRVLVLYNGLINQAPRGGILDSTLLILDEESLSDPLVDNDHCDVGLLLGQVVGLIDGLSELNNLLLKNLASHAITDSISVDNEVLWVVSMLFTEMSKRPLDGILQLLVYDLLPFALEDPVTVVLAPRFVDSGTETDN